MSTSSPRTPRAGPTSRILIADDHPIFRRGVKDVVEAAGHVVVAEASDGVAALAALDSVAVDAVIVDVNMPVCDGLSFVKQARARGVRARMIMLSLHDDDVLVRAAFAAGANGYVLKDGAADEVVHALDVAARGERYLTPSLEPALAPGNEKDADLAALTHAELRVLAMLADDVTSNEIAARLGCSLRTVQNHRAHAVQKLGLAGANRLLAFAVEHRARVRAALQARQAS
jgi:DNA-binding NarL/FixJ family response regulator